MQKCKHFYNKYYIFVSNFNQKVRFLPFFSDIYQEKRKKMQNISNFSCVNEIVCLILQTERKRQTIFTICSLIYGNG